ncbi:MAG: anthranilate synthase/aminodeoxychorismate synthase-like glutamine amidotransferase [Arenicella sp.]|jgi:anthranilate synthase/aminodeoxychorismate synthase-like glutamine amidotransferase
MKILLIDNYDSFTYNLKSLLEKVGADVTVERNDRVNSESIENADALVFSPGPGIPSEAAQLMDIVQTYHTSKPMLGICLGMQAIGEIFGGELELMDRPIHGFSDRIVVKADSIFNGLEHGFDAARYHSWVVKESSIINPLKVIAKSPDEKVMAIKHFDLPIYGFQFHPESVLTEVGEQLMINFLSEVKVKSHAKIT